MDAKISVAVTVKKKTTSEVLYKVAWPISTSLFVFGSIKSGKQKHTNHLNRENTPKLWFR